VFYVITLEVYPIGLPLAQNGDSHLDFFLMMQQGKESFGLIIFVCFIYHGSLAK
jgi:hypothetical protein